MPCGIIQDRVKCMRNIRTYSELIQIPTFIERFEYLKLSGMVGETTFGGRRYLNQILYKTDKWLALRDRIIIRDNGCDLGILDRELYSRITVHHMNPITIEDILSESPFVWDPEFLITSGDITHKAIHYSNSDLLVKEPIIRRKYDTCPWKH